jgi:hypothetical protein
MAVMLERVYDLAHHLLDCVCERLGSTCPGRSCVAPGRAPSFENCCAGVTGGQLTVNAVRTYPSTTFPDPSRGQRANCISPYWVVQYDIALMRCTPVTSGNKGEAPTCDQLDANAQLVMRDLATVHLAIACCLDDEDDLTTLLGTPVHEWLLQGQELIGPDGGCAGSNTTVLVGIPPCVEC